MDAGADKVSINSAALGRSGADYATRRGSTAARRSSSPSTRGAAASGIRGPQPQRHGARDRGAVEWAREAASRGAGEILLTSIDRDGTRAGFDCELTAAVSDAVPIPVIASGGAGAPEHFAEVFTCGRADAALAASVFHFSEHAVRDLKQFLAARGIPMRLVW